MEKNWNEAWQSQWEPFLAGERWYLAPPWDKRPAPPGRIRLDLHPGNYFGNGDHSTTQMILGLMEQAVQPGCRFADIGCGSGLLCIAAKMLGAGEVSGCDLDPGAIAAAREHLPGASFYEGSTENYTGSQIDVAAANLALGVQEQIEPELFRIIRPGGTLIVSGVLEEQLPPAEAAFPPSRWKRLSQQVSGGWAALLLESLK